MSPIELAAVLSAVVVLASMISVELGVTVALLELTLGVIAGNLFDLGTADWLDFIAAFASIVLTFLAGMEVDTDYMRDRAKATIGLGVASFAGPFLVATLVCYLALDWSGRASLIAGTALSTTSLAVVYAVLVERGLSDTRIGKLLMSATFVTDLCTALALSAPCSVVLAQEGRELLPYRDVSRAPEARAVDLVSRMTLEEKAAQLINDAPAIPRLGVREYNWWNEGLHGVAAAGYATVFPQAIGMAATWDAPLLGEAADVISTEFRAKYLENRHRFGGSDWFGGLTVWSPNINIFRDPRWGRGHETYGECPYLTGRLGVALCKGLQGDDPKYLKLVATPKHFAVHSGPEGLRHSFDARASAKDLRETYLPAFFECVTEARAYSVMSAYNRTNGEPCSASPTLLQKILRDEWKFEGYVVSDCWAIRDIYEHHGVTHDLVELASCRSTGFRGQLPALVQIAIDDFGRILPAEGTSMDANIGLFTGRNFERNVTSNRFTNGDIDIVTSPAFLFQSGASEVSHQDRPIPSLGPKN